MGGFLNLKAMLSLNASGFAIGLKRAESQGKAFARSIKSDLVQAFGVGALLAFSKKIIDSVDALEDLSDELNVSTKTLQEWQYAAKRNGASAEDVTKFFEAIAESRKRAIDGNEEAIESYQRFGLSVLKLSQMRTPEIGKAIGDVFKNGGDPQILGPFLKELGGKSARKLIPAFKEGLDDLAQAAREAGQVWDKELTLTIKASKTEAERLADTLRGPVANAIFYISKGVTAMVDSLQNYAGGAAAYWGAFFSSVGISKKDLGMGLNWQKWDTAEAHKRGMEAMTGVQESYRKQTEARDKKNKGGDGAMQGPPVANDFDFGYGKRPLDRILSLGMKVIGESSRPEGLTDWQKSGAAVRQSATEPILKSIDKNTERTAERIEALSKLFSSQSNSGTGFGGGF